MNYLKKTNYGFLIFLILTLLSACSSEDPNLVENSKNQIETTNKSTITDYDIAARYAPVFFQDVDITDGWCRNQSKSGSADWMSAVDYDGDWDTSNNWENMESARDNGKLIPYVYYYVTYTETHYFILYSVYHPRDWTDIPFLCSLDAHENDMEAALITAKRGANGEFKAVIDAQTIWHSDVFDYSRAELLMESPGRMQFFIEAKGHGIRSFRGSSDTDSTYIKYYFSENEAVSPDKESDNLPLTVHYNLLPLEETLWLQRDNPLTVIRTALVGDNGDGSNKASTPWGWENGVLCKNPAQYLINKYGWTNFSTDYISDTPIQ